MGASLTGALLEKLGVGNYPIREVGLTDYLTGQVDLNCGRMQQEVAKKIQGLAAPVRLGGVSIAHRDSHQPTAKTDPARVSAQLAAYADKKYKNLAELYFDGKRIFAESLTYKPTGTFEPIQIEFATDLLFANPNSMLAAYEKNFPGVQFIHLRRDYAGWINSMALQASSKPTLSKRWGYFSPVGLTRRYRAYNRCADQLPGINIDFKDFFEGPDAAADQLAAYLKLPQASDLKTQDFDLWSTKVPYQSAFTMADARASLLSKKTQWLLSQIGRHSSFHDKLLERFTKLAFTIDREWYAIKKGLSSQS